MPCRLLLDSSSESDLLEMLAALDPFEEALRALFRLLR